ncbi:MAG: hypothetical protein HF982_04395 [Desulfobacteraceae bacterium]|nr:hypothetical protein [Desulfobacteraceae bacterium]MBC2718823.1 hypothetical protein [Desulfobacteraceae bacterium]
MRATAIKENISKIEQLENKYPNRLKLFRSENDVDSINMDMMMKGNHQDFDNADSDMPKFLAEQLESRKEVAIIPAGKSKVLVLAGHGLFKS